MNKDNFKLKKLSLPLSEAHWKFCQNMHFSNKKKKKKEKDQDEEVEKWTLNTRFLRRVWNCIVWEDNKDIKSR